MRIAENLQRTPEWYEARRGKATASRFADIMATIKSGEAAARRNYRVQLALERVTGVVEQAYVTADMERGTELEPLAVQYYEGVHLALVEPQGFVCHPVITGVGCSPDGFVGADGLIEIKCPKASNHLTYVLAGVLPEEYRAQVQGQLWITGRAWCDFMSYSPDMPEHLQAMIVRVARDEEYIATLESTVVDFLAGVDKMVSELEEMA